MAEDEDLAMAKTLQAQFDQELLEISSDDDVCFVDSVERDHQLAVKLQAKYETEAVHLLSDSDDDIIIQASAGGSTAPQNPVKREIKDECKATGEVKMFRAEPADLNAREYFIEELQTWVDPECNFEWKFIEVLPDIRALFEKFDALFFQSRFKSKNFNIVWSDTMGASCTNRNFNDEQGRYTIALNAPLLALRPRIEIISVILHEMIHAFLKLEKVIEPDNGHGDNFRKIMIFLNNMLQTNISFSHKLYNTNMLCRTQWYRCTGICHNYKPFRGIVRSTEGPPSLHNEWWKDHSDSCGGTYYKIYEMSKIINEEVSTRYAVNVRYMLPKRENIRGRFKTKLPVKESYDLTAETPRLIASSDSTEVISLDTGDTPSQATSSSCKVADSFIAHFNRSIAFSRDSYEMQCPICQERVKRKLFDNHIDGCKGFVRNVSWKRSSNGKIVQNGLLELKATPGLDASTPSPPSTSSAFGSYQQIKRKRFG
ncbi:DNA-dependent metalloprotease dvc-1-like [Anopheles aquasalis]|uniref:DNA-dependent metalloprotease dvc-1-like n=1 Tax=Anopheles aquasalis TaxID=42839 RepID=UPI00215A9515|nr:DNA-dependent metalloprotease dvc-1-like [Anopheles aquasalis]